MSGSDDDHAGWEKIGGTSQKPLDKRHGYSYTVWNAFRFANLALKKGDTVSAFLLAKGVECESLDTEKFSVTQQMWDFAGSGDKIYACGTCLKLRGSDSTELCPLSTMEDLYRLVQESDKVVSL